MDVAFMKKSWWRFQRKAVLLLAVLLVDGGLLGSAAGILRAGKTGAPEGYPAAAYRASHKEAPGSARSGKGASQKQGGYGGRKSTFQTEGNGNGQKVAALTFDDGPHKEHTAKLLDGLKERGVKATFFLMGQNIEGNEGLIRRMQQEGHLIGNHSYRHIQLTNAGEAAVCEAVEQTEEMIEEITGVRPQYLRPPYGDWNDRLECQVDMTTVFWTVDSLDWKLQNTNQIIRQVEKKLGDGDIILMHDVFPTSVEAALELVDRLQEEGYSFVTVEELLID